MRNDYGAKVRLRRDTGFCEITVSGEYDLENDDLLRTAWRQAEEHGGTGTVLDLSGVTFADSSLLNNLLEARRRYACRGWRLVLSGPLQDPLVRLLSLTGTLEHFTVAAGRQEALDLVRP